MKSLGILALLLLLMSPLAQAGKIVIMGDDWTLHGGFDATTYVDNVGAFFKGGTGGHFLAWLDGGAYSTRGVPAFSAASGQTVTTTTVAADLQNLTGYDGLFLAGGDYIVTPQFLAFLKSYVNAGGNVHITAGYTSSDGPSWNSFLNQFGLTYGSLNGQRGSAISPIAPGDPILTNVSQLYYDNGTTVGTFGAVAGSRVVANIGGGLGFIAVYESSLATPEPGAVFLIGTGLLGLAVHLERRSKALTVAIIRKL